MKQNFFKTCLTTVFMAALAVRIQAQVPVAQTTQKPQPMTLKVMTFNLRYASATPPNAWPQRRPVTSELLRQSAPDIVGTQEGFYHQLKDIAADRPEYSWLGTGREGGSKGEFMAIFYRRDRLEPLEYDHFWLSDTPNVIGSSTWGNNVRRMVTWIRFRDIPSGREFYFWNTHFDHEVQAAREKSSSLVAARINALNTKLPIILTGDFNADARDNKAYDILLGEGQLTDTWFSAKTRPGQNYASFHGYKPPIKDGPHIDWILTRGAVQAESTRIVDFQRGGQYPSDHFPIEATLNLE